MKKSDQIMEWQGFGDGFGKWVSRCRIRVYDDNVVVATELPDNPGTSITNCAENVAMMVLRDLAVDMRGMVYIEHYPEVKSPWPGKPPMQQEQFCIVEFQVAVKKNPLDPTGKTQSVTLVQPRWRPLKKSHVESLIGGQLDD